MKIKIALAVMFALLMSACTGPASSTGWNSFQKNEFLRILQSDNYMSLCDQTALYQKVRVNPNPQLMTTLLVNYADNLANSCLVNNTGFTAYTQTISKTEIQNKLRSGQSIKSILRPYVPEYRQFNALIAQYRAQQRNGASPELLHKIRLNIERVKLMKPGLGKTYALVNIPEFKVRVIENDKTSVAMKVITGKRGHETPIFSANLKYITLNPAWNVPDSIARNEIIPKTLRNRSYLKRHRLVIRKDYDLNSPAQRFNASLARHYVGGKGPVPFKFIETPSNRNALGRVKFIFPNHHSVYMHDTPTKSLFKRKTRAFSHGCVRLENPIYMLEYISKHYTAHDYADVLEKYNSMKTHYLKIVKPLPVHTAYLTTYVDDNGELLSLGDIYGYDKTQNLNF